MAEFNVDCAPGLSSEQQPKAYPGRGGAFNTLCSDFDKIFDNIYNGAQIGLNIVESPNLNFHINHLKVVPGSEVGGNNQNLMPPKSPLNGLSVAWLASPRPMGDR